MINYPKEITGSFTGDYDSNVFNHLMDTLQAGRKMDLETVYKMVWWRRIPRLILYWLYWRMGYRHPDQQLKISFPDMYIAGIQRFDRMITVDFTSRPLTEEV